MRLWRSMETALNSDFRGTASKYLLTYWRTLIAGSTKTGTGVYHHSAQLSFLWRPIHSSSHDEEQHESSSYQTRDATSWNWIRQNEDEVTWYLELLRIATGPVSKVRRPGGHCRERIVSPSHQQPRELGQNNCLPSPEDYDIRGKSLSLSLT